jgi:glyoxalase family protein
MTAQAVRNVEFYTQLLGLRLVKKTVNQDDPSSYHLFYADEIGRPGTDLTFFDIPHLAPNRPGTRSISRTDLRVTGREALAFWQNRFAEHGVTQGTIHMEAGRAVLPFQDFEGQQLVLVDDTDAPLQGGTPWERSPVPMDMGIRGLASVSLTVADPEPTAWVLTEVMGFRLAESESGEEPERQVLRFDTGPGGPGAQVQVVVRPDLPPERLGRGGVHHVAFRVPDFEQHEAWVDRLTQAGLHSSGIIDRYYFKSIYFREPNGILFELATDGPGFVTDEDANSLGERLALPPFLEPQRARIEANLKPL